MEFLEMAAELKWARNRINTVEVSRARLWKEKERLESALEKISALTNDPNIKQIADNAIMGKI